LVVFPLDLLREGTPRATPDWNIGRLREDEQAVKAAGEHWDELSDYRTPISVQATPSELEAEGGWIQDSLKHAPGRPPNARSKRWWTDEIEQERRQFGHARRDVINGAGYSPHNSQTFRQLPRMLPLGHHIINSS
jgi:hypothetical protein